MRQGLLLVCRRCGKTWARKSLTRLPVHCAKCNSPYWNKPRYRRLKATS